MMETLGKMPRKIASSGTRSKDYFDRYGDLKRVRRLKFWPLDRVLVERYSFSEPDAKGFADFLRPMLDFAPEDRPSAAQCLKHSWLN
jgi:serine/threonine-protein kinase SRPK3